MGGGVRRIGGVCEVRTRNFLKIQLCLVKVGLKHRLLVLQTFNLCIHFSEFGCVVVKLLVRFYNGFILLFGLLVIDFLGCDCGGKICDPRFELVRMSLLSRKSNQSFLLSFQFCDPVLTKTFDGVKRLRVPMSHVIRALIKE